jgi:hypothetical protein
MFAAASVKNKPTNEISSVRFFSVPGPAAGVVSCTVPPWPHSYGVVAYAAVIAAEDDRANGG